MTQPLAFIEREAIIIGAAALGAVEVAISSGSPLKIALQGALPVMLGAAIRSLQQPSSPVPTTTKEEYMADLTALKQAVADLVSVAQTVQNTVTAIKAESTPQADVDAVTAQVQQAATQLHSVSA